MKEYISFKTYKKYIVTMGVGVTTLFLKSEQMYKSSRPPFTINKEIKI
ncbi:hypothetical protein BMS3Abin17_00107 [archaeon BMS3Abin17]|nr:hypothetical protein BMS3Abin17_00107 [archaeon BMS3Abin17]